MYALPNGSHDQCQRARVRSGARRHLGLRPRVPLRRGGLRDAAHLQRPAVPLRPPHAPAAQVGWHDRVARAADRRRARRALPRDDARGGPGRRAGARGLHPHARDPRHRRAHLRSGRHANAVDRRHRQAERAPGERGVRARRARLARRRRPQPSVHGEPAHQVEQPSEQRARRCRRRSATAAFEGVMRNFKGELAECTQSNLFIVKNGAALTPPLDAGLLPGITRAFLFEVGVELDIPVREAVLRDADLLGADEAFLTSTTREVVPIVQVDEHKIGTGRSWSGDAGAARRLPQEGRDAHAAASGRRN